MFYNYIMSSVSDHVQLMKSKENKYDSVLINENGYTLMIQQRNMTKGHLLLRPTVYPITLNFQIIIAHI
jgi:hypothetical protein